jgi:hypothetical protein
MAWGRGIVAFLMVAFVVLGEASVLLAAIPGLAASAMKNFSAPGLTAEEDAALSAPYQNLSTGRTEALMSRLNPNINRAAFVAQVPLMQRIALSTPPKSSRLITWTKRVGTDGDAMSAVREFTYADRVVRTETTLGRAKDGWQLDAFYVSALPIAKVNANKLSLAGRPPAFIAFVVAAAILPLFVLATALAALFQNPLKRRWLWLIFILAGITTFRMNGATGDITFQPLSLQLFSGSAFWSGSAFEPWVFGLSVPLGAVLFWLRRFLPTPANKVTAGF